MTKVIEYSEKNYSLWKREVDFIRRGDSLYWNSRAIKTIDKLNENSAVPLSSIADILKNSINPKKDLEYNLIELSDIEGNSGLIAFRKLLGKEINSNKFEFEKNDVLFGRLRFYLKNIGIAPCDGIGSTELRIIRPFDEKFTPEYIFAYLRSNVVDNILSLRSGGSNHPRISDLDVKTLPILEIKNIEKVTSIVRTGLTLFEKYQLGLKDANKIFNDHLKVPKEIKTKKFHFNWKNDVDMTFRLDPNYWAGENEFFKDSIRIKDVVKEVFMGVTPPWRVYSDYEGCRILKVRHLSEIGNKWDLRDRDYVNEIFYENNKKASVKENDLIIASAAHQASYIGKDVSIIDYFPDDVDKAIAVAELNVIRVNKEIINPYVLLLLMKENIFYNEIQRHTTGQTSHFYPKDLEKLPVPKHLLKENFPAGEKIEELIRPALAIKRESKARLNEAVRLVEKELDEILS